MKTIERWANANKVPITGHSERIEVHVGTDVYVLTRAAGRGVTVSKQGEEPVTVPTQMKAIKYLTKVV